MLAAASAHAWSYPAVLNTNAATDSGGDYQPRLTTDGAGNWVAVWSCSDSLRGTIGTDPDILVSRSTDNGATWPWAWTGPAALNTNAAADSGDDLWPQVATDGARNSVAVWHSAEPNVGGSIATDADILYVTEVWPTAPVGGVAQLPGMSDSSAPNYIALAVLAAAALAALGAGAWHARRHRPA